MNRKISLVIADVDATLVNEQKELTPRTKEILRYLHNHNIQFGIASGRPLDEIKQYAQRWGLDYQFDVLIGMNGSELYVHSTQEEYSYFKLKTSWMKEIMEFMKRYESNPMMYVDGVIYCRIINERMKFSAASSHKEAVIVPIEKFYEKENAKIMFRMSKEDVLDAENYLKEHPHPNYAGFKTQDTLLEFCDKRIKKSYALKKYCELHNIPLENVVAFGDTTNDNDMIECSGIGVCMINGSEDTKAIADEITEFDNDHDGLAIHLERLLNL